MTKAQKSPRKLPVILMCLLLVVTLAVNAACIALYPAITTFMTANLNARLMGGSSALSLSPEEAKEASLAMAQTLEEEGIVLLENREDALPLAQGTPVNLFGYASVDPIYGGTGSGASDTSSNIDLIQGLENAGFTVNQDLVDFYRNSGVSRPDQSGYTGSNSFVVIPTYANRQKVGEINSYMFRGRTQEEIEAVYVPKGVVVNTNAFRSMDGGGLFGTTVQDADVAKTIILYVEDSNPGVIITGNFKYNWDSGDSNLQYYFSRLIALRNGREVLQTGWYIPAYADEDVLAYFRTTKQGKDRFGKEMEADCILVVLNRNSVKSATITIDTHGFCQNKLHEITGMYPDVEIMDNKAQIRIEPE